MKGVKHGRRFSCVHILAGEEEHMGDGQSGRRAVGMKRLTSCQASVYHKESSTHDRQARGPYNHGVQATAGVRPTIRIVGRPPWWGEACGTIDAILGKEEHMADSTFDHVQRLVEQLSPHEQAHLLAFLALRMAQVVTATAPTASHTPPETAAAWE